MPLFSETDAGLPARLARFVGENGLLLLPVLLGGAAVYLLLPRPRGRAVTLGAVAAVAALAVAGASALKAAGPVHPETVLFYVFGGLAVAAGLAVVTQRNPARAAIAFAVVVLSVCGLFLLQAAPFLMAASLIIYAGAIIVTFLFVLMLAHQYGPSDADDRSRNPLFSCVAAFALLGCLVLLIHRAYDTGRLDELLARAEVAQKQASYFDMREALRGPGEGTPDDYRVALEREVDRLQGTDGKDVLGEVVADFRKEVEQKQPDVERVRQVLGRLTEAGRRVRTEYAALRQPDRVPLSGYAGPPPNAEAPRALPAENVAAVGRTLYSDHLLAVELAGTLLLVATAGAIAVTGRREGRA